MAYFRAAIGGGGGSDGAYGTCNDVTGNAQPVTINTGLTEIKRFFLKCYGNSGGTVNALVTYNKDISATNYITYVGANVYDILRRDKLVLTKDAVACLGERLK